MFKEKLYWGLKLLRDLLICPFPHLFPRNKNKVLFGAWGGRSFSDNPKYFMLYLLEHTELRCIWVGNENLRSQIEALNYPKTRLTFVRKGSLTAFWHFWTAKTFVCNINWRSDICDLPSSSSVRILNLWHGIPFKKLGENNFFYGAPSQPRPPISKFRHFMQYLLKLLATHLYPQKSWTSVASVKMAKELETAYPGRFQYSRILFCGQPRNDFLIKNSNNQHIKKQLKSKYASLLSLPIEQKWFLYLPTFRYSTNEVFSFSTLSENEHLQAILKGQNAIILEKQHPRILQRLHPSSEIRNNTRLISEEESASIDLQELLLVSDRLITDYSSCFFDFKLMNRPVIHFAYDYNMYASADTGIMYNLDDVCAGPIVLTKEELIKFLSTSNEFLLEKSGEKVEEPLYYEKGNASSQLVRLIY